MKANSLVKLDLVAVIEILLALLPKTTGRVMQVLGECLRFKLTWVQACERILKEFLP